MGASEEKGEKIKRDSILKPHTSQSTTTPLQQTKQPIMQNTDPLQQQKKQQTKKPATSKQVEKQADKKDITPKMEEVVFQNIQKNIEETNRLLTQQHEKLNQSYDDIVKIQNEFATKYAKAISQIQEATQKKLHEPPKFEDVTVPKDKTQKIIKAVVPIMIGITALFRPGKYGESLVYFNTMMQSIKANDMQKFAEALKQWELDFKYALQERESNIKGLEMELQKLSILQQAGIKGAEYKAKRIESHIAQLQNTIDNAYKSYDSALKIMKMFHDMKMAEEKLKLMKAKPLQEKVPTSIKEFEIFSRMSPEKQERYLKFLQEKQKGHTLFGNIDLRNAILKELEK